LRESRLALASGNRGKITEIRRLLSGLPLEILTLDDFTNWPVLEEKGDTFEENASAKARALSGWAGLPALADDSGLEVEELGGAPGVRSARYAGERGDDAANITRLLKEMKDVPPRRRGARFVCVLALASPSGDSLCIKDTCAGTLTDTPRGEMGFGYDPVFVPEGMQRTMAELALDEKNAISHRGKALRRLHELLRRGEPPWLFE
jgi:XTP/dITP diphosphohydrolase